MSVAGTSGTGFLTASEGRSQKQGEDCQDQEMGGEDQLQDGERLTPRRPKRHHASYECEHHGCYVSVSGSKSLVSCPIFSTGLQK